MDDDKNLPEMEKMISSFTKITSSSREVAKSFLETHQWNLNAAVSAFTENEVTGATAAEPNVPNPSEKPTLAPFPSLRVNIPFSSFSLFEGSSGYSQSRLRLRTPSPPRFYLNSTRPAAANPFGRVTIQRDVERSEEPSRSMSEETDSPEFEEEESQEVITYTVTSWRNGFTVDDSPLQTLDVPENATFLDIISRMESPRELGQICAQIKLIRREEEDFIESQAPLHGVGSTLAGSDSASTMPPALAAFPSMRVKEPATERPEQSPRILSEETVSPELQEQQQEDLPYQVETYIVTIWRNGYTVDDSPLKSLDDPENAAHLERITSMESPRLFDPIRVQIKLIRREEEDFTESPCVVGTEPQDLATSPPPSMDLLVVDPTAPTTSIQLKLADGTCLVTQFNTHHTIRDVRGFIDASRPDSSKDYQLLIMGVPPKPLPDFDQTIEQAGITTNSVLIQKL